MTIDAEDPGLLHARDRSWSSALHRKIAAARPPCCARSGDNEPHELARVAAQELSREDGPRIAVFDLDGFDTHAAQGGSDGEHGEQLNNYDTVLSRAEAAISATPVMTTTLILTLTEFGRKFEQNGSALRRRAWPVRARGPDGRRPGEDGGESLPTGQGTRVERPVRGPGSERRTLSMRARSIAPRWRPVFDVDFGYMKATRLLWDEPLTDLTDSLFRV